MSASAAIMDEGFLGGQWVDLTLCSLSHQCSIIDGVNDKYSMCFKHLNIPSSSERYEDTALMSAIRKHAASWWSGPEVTIHAAADVVCIR